MRGPSWTAASAEQQPRHSPQRSPYTPAVLRRFGAEHGRCLTYYEQYEGKQLGRWLSRLHSRREQATPREQEVVQQHIGDCFFRTPLDTRLQRVVKFRA